MHCNLRTPDTAPVLIRLNYDARAEFEVARHIRCRLIALFIADTLRYTVTLSFDSVTFTFDLEHL